MPYDGLMMHRCIVEMQALLLGGRVDRVMQPEQDEIHLMIRNNGATHRLLLCANADRARAHISQHNKPNPATPSVFCMLLRKHLVGAHVRSFAQFGLDRAMKITFDTHDDFGDASQKALIVEIMGKHSNIICVDEQDTIVDSIKRVSPSMSRFRQVLPGLHYELPPQQEKRNPLDADTEQVARILLSDSAAKVAKLLSDAYMGIAVQTTEAILIGIGMENKSALAFSRMQCDEVARQFCHIMQTVQAGGEMCVLHDMEDNAVAIYPFALPLPNAKTFASPCTGLDAYYIGRDTKQRYKQKIMRIAQLLNTLQERVQRKITSQQEEIEAGRHAETWLRYGQLITANIYQMQKGMRNIELMDYETNEQVEIALDYQLSPAENAQKYFKQYNKAKSALRFATEQQQLAFLEREYIEGQLENLDKCQTDEDIADLSAELAREGYLSMPGAKGKKQAAQAASKPIHCITQDGTHVYIGKNNTQNEWLTFKFSAPEDIWMHAKDMPGSHVIVKAAHPSTSALQQAAMLAAFYSRGKKSDNVAVDYCIRRYVKKPSGAKPGKVIYTNQRTLFATPDEHLIATLRQD